MDEPLTAERPLANMVAVAKTFEGGRLRAVSAIGSPCVALAVGCGGGHLHAGPVVAYSEARGPTFGWEAGAGGFGLVRLNAGGSYRIEPAPVQKRPEEPDGAPGSTVETDDSAYVPPEHVHYLAFEPIGLSIGVDVSELGDVGLMGGFWAGWIVDPNSGGAFDGASNPNRFFPDVDCPNYDPEPALLLSGAIGLRHLGGAWEVYATPKAVLFYCFEYAN
jgi:hypothetical protein